MQHFKSTVALQREVEPFYCEQAKQPNERNLNRDQVVNLPKFFNSSEEEYISLWLCDKVIEAVDNDPLATQGIKKALTKIKN